MKKIVLILSIVFCGMGMLWAQNVVLGIEANGPDSATKEAYNWRKANVYDGIYAKAGFKVVLISQSSKAKVLDALASNKVTHITGCGHGSATVYTGYNQGYVFSTSDTSTLQKLAGKHIHLLSCLTAQQLGPAMMKSGASSYAGYHPSFYFTWKSTALFFDADAALDRAFAAGKTAPQAYQETINRFNEVLEILKTQDPDGVKYIVIDRDGLRCMPAARAELDCVLPLEMASRILYAKNPESGEFVSFADFQNLGLRSNELSRAEFKNLVIASYERMDREFELGILSYGRFTRDQLIEEIKQETEVGKQMVELEQSYLNKVAQSRWSQSMEVTTDSEGSIAYSGEFDAPMTITTKEVKATWAGEPSEFKNVTLVFNNETLFNAPVVNGQGYPIVKKINKGHVSGMVKAVGGPKNAKVKVTVTFSLW